MAPRIGMASVSLCLFQVIALTATTTTASAGFSLTVDKDSLRYNSGTSLFEIDVVFGTNDTGPTPSKIYDIVFKLSFATPINGLGFVGVKQPDVNPLFPTVVIGSVDPPGNVDWGGSVASTNNAGITVPSAPASAFTIEMNYTLAELSTANIIFSGPALYRETRTTDLPPGVFATAGASGLSFTATPEPGSIVLTTLGMSLLAVRRYATSFRRRHETKPA